jgi:cysteine synthase
LVLYKELTSLIGGTPLLELNIGRVGSNRVFGKMENMNPLASVKDRLAFAMITDAEKRGVLKSGMTLVEPTSGNTGIALSYIGALRGYKVKLVMPESMSIERRKIMSAFGAELILTPKEKGMSGAVEEAKKIISKDADAIMLDQFSNPAGPKFHYDTTGPEIVSDLGRVPDIFVAGVGTGSTISGVGKKLKELNPKVKIIAVEPKASCVLSGGKPGPHKIQGIGAGFIPKVLDLSVVDEILQVNEDDAINTAKRMMLTDGVFAGISAGANVWSAMSLATRPEHMNSSIVTIICDTAERYLSTDLFK